MRVVKITFCVAFLAIIITRASLHFDSFLGFLSRLKIPVSVIVDIYYFFTEVEFISNTFTGTMDIFCWFEFPLLYIYNPDCLA